MYRCISPGHVKILLVFAQSVSGLNSMWKTVVMEKMMPALGIVNMKTTGDHSLLFFFVNLEGIGLSCIFPFLSEPANEMMVMSVLPVATVMIGSIFVIIFSVVARKTKIRASIVKTSPEEETDIDLFEAADNYTPRTWERIANIVITTLYLFYFSELFISH